jgi:hypothetical protein
MRGIPPKYLSDRVAEARSQSSIGIMIHWGKPLIPVKTLARREREQDKRGMIDPRSIRGRASGRQFEPHNAGGLIRQLSSERVRITSRGVDVVERHVSRFGPDRANAVMIERLRAIADERLEPTPVDRGFYTHELREYVRYRRLGYESGTPADPEAAHTLWNNAHTATLEDYGLPVTPSALYHPEAERYIPK